MCGKYSDYESESSESGSVSGSEPVARVSINNLNSGDVFNYRGLTYVKGIAGGFAYCVPRGKIRDLGNVVKVRPVYVTGSIGV
jgi:hypothetical protein